MPHVNLSAYQLKTLFDLVATAEEAQLKTLDRGVICKATLMAELKHAWVSGCTNVHYDCEYCAVPFEGGTLRNIEEPI